MWGGEVGRGEAQMDRGGEAAQEAGGGGCCRRGSRTGGKEESGLGSFSFLYFRLGRIKLRKRLV